MAKPQKSERTNSVIFVLFAIAALGFVGYLSVSSWMSLGDVDISTNGWIAIVIGVVVSLAVGGGLMALVFYSSRKHYDDSSQ